MLTDTHCHILKDNYENFSDVILNLEKNNIKRIIVNGYDLKTNKEVLELTQKYHNVYGAIGLHPNSINDGNINETIAHIKENINNEKILAVGEIGLDYYRNDNKDEQKKIFKEMLNIATENKKPIIVHNRNSTDDLIKILKDYQLKGIMHSFSGSLETAREFIKLGYKLGINGIVTFKNTNLRQTLKELEVLNILLETDSPYLSPEPLRGKINEPKNLNFIAPVIAKIYNLELGELSKILEENLFQVFDIEKQ